MNRLSKRLSDLEQANAPASVQVVRRFEGQTEAEALAAYERDNGPIGPDNGRALRVFIHKPFAAPFGA
jgi:hypothetical protein